MSRLNRAARRLSDDRGGVSVIVAALLAGGVLLGMTAIVVDIGLVYAEREELQSGADAAAMEIALDCAKERPDCSASGVRTAAEQMASANARDARAAVRVCGSDGRGPLRACPNTPAGNLTTCLDVSPPVRAHVVEVRTTTRTASGGDRLLPAFAGAAAPDGTKVAACARVAWGVPRRGELPLTIPACEWARATDDGRRYAPAPPAAVTRADAHEREIVIGDPGAAATCGTSPAGWLEAADCVPDLAGQRYDGLGGDGPPEDCRDALDAAIGQVRLIPVHADAGGPGPNRYRLYGVAAFVLTGYRLPDKAADSIVTGDPPDCAGPPFCVAGYFVDTLVDLDSSADGSLPSLGAISVKTIG